MVRELTPVDIGAVSREELERLVDEVQQTGRSRIVRRGDRDVALLSPLPAVSAPKRPKRAADPARDSIWNIVGIGSSETASDVAENKHDYLADAILSHIDSSDR